ncbi:MAG: site-2 protease family protein [Deltaproteobacteria bacterium]|nr:site-2 protease family protein [Deltaproteobacteria bacterium]
MWLEKLLYFAILLGALVLVHELGHFIVAKLCRVQVLKFSVGFGPELVGLQLGETRYAISAFPLGGFVRLAGEDASVETVGGPPSPPLDPARLLTARPRWQRAAIFLAGPLANLMLTPLLFWAMAYGRNEITPPVVETVLPGSPAEQARLRAGDRIVSVDGRPVATFDEVARIVGRSTAPAVGLEIVRDGERRPVEVALELFEQTDELQRRVRRSRMGVLSFRRLPLLAVPSPAAPAHEAGLRSFDQVVAVDGAPVERFEDLELLLRRGADRELSLTVERRMVVAEGALRVALPTIETVRLGAARPIPLPTFDSGVVFHTGIEPEQVATSVIDGTRAAAQRLLQARDPALRGVQFAGTCVERVVAGSPAADLGIASGDCLLALDGQPLHWLSATTALSGGDPRAVHVAVVERADTLITIAFRLQQRAERAPLRRGFKRLLFGAEPADGFGPGGSEVVYRGLGAAAIEGVKLTATWTVTTLVGIWLLANCELPFESVGGPIMMFDLAARSAESGWRHFLFIMAVISINLAILNLLPVPVLDGGHLLFLLIETLRRHPVSLRAREIATLVGLSLLLILMVAVMRNDIARYWDQWFN